MSDQYSHSSLTSTQGDSDISLPQNPFNNRILRGLARLDVLNSHPTTDDAALGQLDSYTVHFPVDEYIGHLYVRLEDGCWQHQGWADGEVHLPTGQPAYFSPWPDNYFSEDVRYFKDGDALFVREENGDWRYRYGWDEGEVVLASGHSVRFSPKPNSFLSDHVRYLAKVRDLCCLEIWSSSFDSEGIRLIGRSLPTLESLSLGSRQMTPYAVESLADLHKLRSLTLSDHCMTITGNSCVDDDMAASVAFTFPHLTSLALNGSVTDHGVSLLAGMTRLESLTLDSPHFRGSGLAALVDLGNLRALSLRWNLDPRYLVYIEQFPQLFLLDLSDSNLFLEHLEYLPDIPSLRDLKLRHVEVMGADVIEPDWFPNLEHLDLRHADIRDQELIHVDEFQALRTLLLGGTKITDDVLARVAMLPSLETLDLSSTRVTDAGLRYLRTHASLQTIDTTNTDITARGLDDLALTVPNLTEGPFFYQDL